MNLKIKGASTATPKVYSTPSVKRQQSDMEQTQQNAAPTAESIYAEAIIDNPLLRESFEERKQRLFTANKEQLNQLIHLHPEIFVNLEIREQGRSIKVLRGMDLRLHIVNDEVLILGVSDDLRDFLQQHFTVIM